MNRYGLGSCFWKRSWKVRRGNLDLAFTLIQTETNNAPTSLPVRFSFPGSVGRERSEIPEKENLASKIDTELKVPNQGHTPEELKMAKTNIN